MAEGTPRKTIDQFLADGAAVDRAMREAVRQALVRHKRLGESIIVWRDGKVVELPPEEIPVDVNGGTPSHPAAEDPSAPRAD